MYYYAKTSGDLQLLDEFRELVGPKLFDYDFDSIFETLSARSCRRYMDWLYDAKGMILEGKDPYDVLSYFDNVLEYEDERHGIKSKSKM